MLLMPVFDELNWQSVQSFYQLLFLSFQSHLSFGKSYVRFIRTNGRHKKTRSSWLNCALRDDEAVYWVSIGHYEAVAVGN